LIINFTYRQILSKLEFYREVTMQAKSLCGDEPNLITNLANVSAILFNRMEQINWAGFYLVDDAIDNTRKELVLGPFQGQPACTRIPIGRGVCGTAVSTSEVQVIDDVHQFDGHIACDAASNSEIVLPIVVDSKVVAVLDIDSPVHGRFDQDDAKGLAAIVEFFQANWPSVKVN
jgi:L-methionine (R)-S-oxide reductase